METKELRLSGLDSSASAGDKFTHIFMQPVTITGMYVEVSGSDATAFVLALDKRVTIGSDTGRVELDRITLPASNQSGKQYFVKGLFEVAAGQQIVVETITASTADKVNDIVIRYVEGVIDIDAIGSAVESA